MVSEINSIKLIQNRTLSDYFNELINEKIDLKIASNMLLGDISAYLNKKEKIITDTTLSKERFIELVKMYEDNTITSKNLKDILDTVLESTDSIEKIIKDKGIENISNDDEIRQIDQPAAVLPNRMDPRRQALYRRYA